MWVWVFPIVVVVATIPVPSPKFQEYVQESLIRLPTFGSVLVSVSVTVRPVTLGVLSTTTGGRLIMFESRVEVLMIIAVVVPLGVMVPVLITPFIIVTLFRVTLVRLVPVIVELVPVTTTLDSVELETLVFERLLLITVEVASVVPVRIELDAVELRSMLLVIEQPAPPIVEVFTVVLLKVQLETRL